MDSRQQFEEWITKSGLEADLSRGNHGCYLNPPTHWLYCAWVASRESMVVELPEITEDHIFFALNCHMEDPTDDEEDGFNAGVSWCRAFLKQQIAKREKK